LCLSAHVRFAPKATNGCDLNNRSLFKYVMHTLPSEISESIGTSTLFAAWNAAIYVAQVEDDRRGGGRRPLYRRHAFDAVRARRPMVLR
jgi:hypothetical protein